VTEQKRLVLDTNILIRGVFGVRVRSLLLAYEDSVSFYTPDICLRDARKFVPIIAATRHLDPTAALLILDQLVRPIEIVDQTLYEKYKPSARERMISRDIEDWPILATSLLLNCPIWTEDQDFFGSGAATWTTNNVELFLKDM
jgi:predicted nucleic acid-binding protein